MICWLKLENIDFLKNIRQIVKMVNFQHFRICIYENNFQQNYHENGKMIWFNRILVDVSKYIKLSKLRLLAHKIHQFHWFFISIQTTRGRSLKNIFIQLIRKKILIRVDWCQIYGTGSTSSWDIGILTKPVDSNSFLFLQHPMSNFTKI
jgi:hypothetical protein